MLADQTSSTEHDRPQLSRRSLALAICATPIAAGLIMAGLTLIAGAIGSIGSL